MANPIEKRLPKAIRDRMSTLIASGLGLFIGLRYNDYISKIVERLLPDTNGLLAEGAILLGLTALTAWLAYAAAKALDGK